MQLDFKGKVALITGAQQGIGRACALMLAQAGADIAIHYLDDEAAVTELAGQVKAFGRRVFIVQADLSEPGAAQRVVGDVLLALGQLDVVVNNAGIFRRASFAQLSESLWDLTIDVNLRAAVFVCQAAVAAMRKSNTKGAIVNLSSVASFGTPLGVHYSASKGGMDAMTRAIAIDVGNSGIRINAVAPGIILTAQALEGNSKDELADLAAKTLPRRYGSAEEVAKAVLFLASDAASFINGEILAVNGGAHMA